MLKVECILRLGRHKKPLSSAAPVQQPPTLGLDAVDDRIGQGHRDTPTKHSER